MASIHACEALAVHCIDFRIQRFLNEYLERRFPGAYDRVALAGGVKEFPLEQCGTSVRLHGPKTILLIQHEDCGAYGGSGALGEFPAELAFQKEELQKAERTVREHFPDIAVENFLIRLSGEMISL